MLEQITRPSTRAVRHARHLALVAVAAACGGQRTSTRHEPPAPDTLAVSGPPILPGALQARYATGQNGDAQYQIDIAVPPGIQGVQPALSLTYDSQAGNGILGVGWSLSGLSSIQRCKAIPAVDGRRGAITYTASDVYCLDGQRLIAVEGAQGAAGSVYRTELETWRRVVASSQLCGSAPCSFTVTNESGAVWTYGATAASRVAPTGLPGEVRAWAVSSITDLDGNTIGFSYSQAPIAGTSAADGQLYATRIDYTSNGQLQANRSVRFTWAARPDVMTTYQGGWPIVIRAYLTDVVTYVQETQVKDYRLAYQPGAATGRSRVTSAAVCGASGACLTPTAFTWQDTATPSFQGTGELVSLPAGGNGVLPIDVNGDGRGDLVYLDTSQPMNASIYLSTGSALSGCPSPSKIPSVTSQRLFGGDANGDGRVDLIQLWPNGAALDVTTYLSSATTCGFGAGITSAPTQPGGSAVPFTNLYYAMDVNGDGRVDLVLVYPSGPNLQLVTLLASGSAFTGFTYGGSVTIASPSGSGTTGVTTWPMDVNGDGMSDLVMAVIATGKLQLESWLSTGAAFASTPVTSQPGGGGLTGTLELWPLDVNGDGLMDVVQAWADAKALLHLQPFAATGTGAFTALPETATGRGVSDFAAFWPMDANGDGQTDLVQAWNNGKGTLDLVVYRNTGAGLDSGTDTRTTMPVDVANTWPVDLDGDGKTDLLQGGKNLDFFGYLAQGPAPDLVSAIVDGQGGQLALTYAPLSDASVYIAGSAAAALVPTASTPPLACASTTPGAGYPISDALSYNLTQAPALGPSQVVGGGLMSLVKQSVTSNAAGGGAVYSYATTYQYGSALIDRSGRGWLGFAVTRQTDAAGRAQVAIYNQRFPYTGTPAQTLFACGAGATDPGCAAAPSAVLSASSTCYAAAVTATGTSAQQPRVYQAQKLETKNDYYEYGAWSSSQMTTWAYDQCGEVTLASNLGAVDGAGKDLSPADNVYTCSAFAQASCASSSNPSPWLFGLATGVKVSASSACTSFSTFDSASDLSLAKTTYTTDGRMHVASTASYDSVNKVWLSTGYDYDPFGNVKTVVRPGGHAITSTYDAVYETYEDTRTSPADAAGKQLVQRFGYDPRFGNQAATTDANGNTNVTCTDELGRITALQGPTPAGITGAPSTCLASGVTGGGAPTFAAAPILTLQTGAWSNAGGGLRQTLQLLQTWPSGGAPDQRSSQTYLDGLGRSYKHVEQGAPSTGDVVTCTIYDNHDQVTAVSVPQYFTGGGPSCASTSGGPALWSTNSYDLYGRPTRQVRPSGADGTQTSTTTFAYAANDTATITYAAGDPAQLVKVFTYAWFDSDRRVVKMTVPADGNATTSYAYDRLGRLTSVVDPPTSANPKGIANTTSYDSLGRRVRADNPDQNTTGKPGVSAVSWGYSPSDGTLIATTDAKGQKTSFVNDALGRTVATTYSDGTTVQFTWDSARAGDNGNGALTAVASQGADGNTLYQYAYAYDPYRNLLSSAATIAGAPSSFTTQRSYDPPGRTRGITYPDGTSLALDYSFGNLVTATAGGTTYATYGDYTPFGSPGAIAYGNGASESFRYAPQGQLDAQVVLDASQQRIFDDTLAWDAMLNVSSVTDNLKPGGTDYSQTFSYKNGRLTQAVAPGLWGTATYGYDASGNLTSNDGVTLTYAAHRPVRGARAGAAGPVYSATYDADGNLATRTDAETNLRFTWDAANRLGQVTNVTTGSPLLSSLIYDQHGRRLRKVDSSGVTTWYPDPAFTVTSVGGVVEYTKNVWIGGSAIAAVTTVASGAPGTLPPGTPSPGTVYFHSDHLGSTALTTDATGKLATRMAYRPYGGVFTPATRGPDNFIPKFQGTENDTVATLYYFQSRYYDPAVGRFISPDTELASEAFQIDAFNRFAFATNNPVTFVDPSGHNVWQSIVGALIGTVEILAGVAIDVLSDGALESVGGALIGAGTNGIIYSAQNSKNFSWKQYGIQQGMGAVLGLMTGGFGEIAGGGEAAAEEGVVAATDTGTQGARAEATGAAEQAGGDSMTTGTRATGEVGDAEGGASSDNLAEECNSFVAGTQVATPRGEVQIEALRAGDLVWSRDPATGAIEPNRVLEAVVHPRDAQMVGLEVGGHTITVTPAHPVWLPARGWTPAARVAPGDTVLAPDGSLATIAMVTSRPSGGAVYNLVVDRAHSYFADGVLVHNQPGKGVCDIGGKYDTARKNAEKGLVEANHFPASSSYTGTPYDNLPVGQRPAVNMDYDDHLETETWGSSNTAKQWRAQQTQLMKQGDFAGAMEMDILDMKSITKAATGDSRYLSNGMQQALDFAAQPNPYLNNQPFINQQDYAYLSKLIWKK